MILLIRVDASPAIGAGHAMRCLALGQAWQDNGGAVSIISSELTPAMRECFVSEQFQLLDAAIDHTGDATDARCVLHYAKELGASAIVTDGYRFTEEYHAALTKSTCPTLIIDDYAHLGHYQADFILNQNPGASPGLYSGNPTSQKLLGTAYALLRREFRNVSYSSGRPVKNVLVTLGAADPDNRLDVIVDGLMQSRHSELRFRILSGCLNDNHEQLVCRVAGDRRFIVDRHSDSMSQVYAQTDFAICAGGSSNWEMCVFGIPRLLVILAENQIDVGNQLQSLGIARCLERVESLTPRSITEGLDNCLADTKFLSAAGKSAAQLIDAAGAERVVQKLRTHTSAKHSSLISFRHAEFDDWALLLEWRNDEQTRMASRNSDPIEVDNHRAWLRAFLARPDHKLLIAVCDKVEVGTVRLDPGNPGEMSWTVAPQHRGRGIGTRMVKAALKQISGAVTAIAKTDNIGSCRIAESAGFVVTSQTPQWTEFIYQQVPSDE